MKVIWTNQAPKDYNKILAYLHENWGVHEVRNFVGKTEVVIGVIKKTSTTWSLSLSKRQGTKLVEATGNRNPRHQGSGNSFR